MVGRRLKSLLRLDDSFGPGLATTKISLLWLHSFSSEFWIVFDWGQKTNKNGRKAMLSLPCAFFLKQRTTWQAAKLSVWKKSETPSSRVVATKAQRILSVLLEGSVWLVAWHQLRFMNRSVESCSAMSKSNLQKTCLDHNDYHRDQLLCLVRNSRRWTKTTIVFFSKDFLERHLVAITKNTLTQKGTVFCLKC